MDSRSNKPLSKMMVIQLEWVYQARIEGESSDHLILRPTHVHLLFREI